MRTEQTAAQASMSGTRPRKVFLVADQLALGGAENQLVLLARSLHRRGIETVVLVMFGGGPHEAALRDEGITVVYLGFRGGREIPRDPANTFAAFIRLVRLLRREKPDVVHAFLYYAYVVVAPAARLAGVPVVVAGRRNMGFYKENSKKKAMLAVERVATRMTDRVIAISRAVAENTVRQEGLDANKITTVYNGLAPEAFDEVMPAAIDTALPVVLCVANLRSSKGHKYLIEAMGLLEERGIAGTLLLVGDGVEREGLEEQARRLSADIRFLGLRQDVAALLRRADVFVLPSVSEGLSTAVMEAMAACVPVVATASGGPPELLEGRGLVVPPGDAAALADALATLLADRERARDLAVKAQAWARSHLTLDAMVDEHVQIYSELLARARTR